MPLDLQVKLLRVLETGRSSRVGGDERRPTDVRVIAATNRDPEEAVARGKLREDLLYRLNVVSDAAAAVARSAGDVQLLAEHFLNGH